MRTRSSSRLIRSSLAAVAAFALVAAACGGSDDGERAEHGHGRPGPSESEGLDHEGTRQGSDVVGA